MSRRTTVIAEIGPNHYGEWERAEEMVAAAADAGADAVKFQSYRADQVEEDDPEREWFEKVELPDKIHHDLYDCADQHGVAFLSSPFSVERAKFLVEEVGLSTIKVASSEIINEPMLEYLDTAADEVYLSTGMATFPEVEQAVDMLSSVDLCLMQCTSEYPCPPSKANLNVIDTYRDSFPGCTVGFSDHTLGTFAAPMAVAKGASIVEKHFTTNKSLPGPDQNLSATPAELRELIGRIERVEALRGRRQKEPTTAERDAVEQFRSRFHNTEFKKE